MSVRRTPSALLGFLTRHLRIHKTFLLAVVMLGGIVGFMRLTAHASLVSAFTNQESLRTCSDEGTLFEGMQSVSAVTALFKSTASGVVVERQVYLSTPSMWSCSADPPMAKLSFLASKLPGWYFPTQITLPTGPTVTGYRTRVVTSSAFSSILGEFLREYECKLSILGDRTDEAILSGNDIDEPCTAAPCPDLSFPDFFVRPSKYKDRITADKDRARVALERTLHTMRSFEANYAAARNIWCFELASLDLRNELGLLADATSCMPKIWDAITSLHDRKY